MFHLTEWRAYIIYLELFCMGDLSIVSHLFIYSTMYLYQYGLMDIYFVFGIIVQYWYVYFVVQIVLLLATESWFRGLLCPSDIPLTNVNTHLVYSLRRPRISHFFKELCSFSWRMLLETKVLVLNVFIATGMLLTSALFS